MANRSPIPPKIRPLNSVKPKTSRQEWNKCVQEHKRDYLRAKNEDNQLGDIINHLDFDEPFFRRRAEACLDTLDFVSKRYQSIPAPRPDIIGEEWISLNLGWVTPSLVDRQMHILFAAAIWILDHVDIDDIYAYLPTDERVLEEYYSPDCWHPNYEFDLITSVEYVLDHRNDGTDANRNHRISAFTDAATASRRQHTESKNRFNFDRLIAQIPSEAITAATKKFETQYWKWVDQFFNSMRPLLERLKNKHKEFEELRLQCNTVIDEAVELHEKIEQRQKRRMKQATRQSSQFRGPIMPAASASSFQDPLNSAPFPFSVDEEEQADRERMSQLIDRILFNTKSVDGCLDEIDQLSEEISRYSTFYTAENILENDAEVLPEKCDPFELCFAFLYLIDSDSELPWLYGSVCGFLMEKLENLPWGLYIYHEEEDAIQAAEEYSGKPVEMPDWNLRCYKKKDESGYRSLTQLLYEETGCIVPENLHAYDSIAGYLRKYGVKGKDAVLLLTVMSVLRQSKYRHSPWNIDMLQQYDNTQEQPKDTKPEEQIAALKDEIRLLRGALHDAEKTGRQTRATLEEERKAARRDHRELADLRELVFLQMTAAEEEEETEEEGSILPYTVQQGTIVFGGHDTWVKTIKQLVRGNIRFIDKDLVFDPAIVRSAEVIWIQTNAISHKQYYRIIDAARIHKKAVRYFTYSSARKGAIQIAESDMEKTK